MNVKSILIPFVVLLAFAFSATTASGQYGRYTTRQATIQCATGNCPTATQTAPLIAPKVETPKAQEKDQPTSKEETPKPQESAEKAETTDKDSGGDGDETVDIAAADAPSGLGLITLVYPSDAQAKDDSTVFAARRAREPVYEDDDPIDSETPIGSIRTIGARLRELTSAIEKQQEKLDTISQQDGGDGAILESLQKLRDADAIFQKDSREGLTAIMNAIRQQNERLIAQSAQRVVQRAVAPEPSTYWKWGAIALGILAFITLWIIIIGKLISWAWSLGKTAITRGIEATIAGVQTSANVLKQEKKNGDEIRL